MAAFLDAIVDADRRQECRRVLEIMQRATGEDPRLWGSSMVGFGSYHYTYESGREGDWFLTGFSPRKSALTLYIMSGLDRLTALLHRLGRYKTGKSCLYIRRLADVDARVLEELVATSVAEMRRSHH